MINQLSLSVVAEFRSTNTYYLVHLKQIDRTHWSIKIEIKFDI